jgi:hypothetical protein
MLNISKIKKITMISLAISLCACKSIVDMPSLNLKDKDSINNNNLTIGQVSLTLKKNETNQTEVIEKFGAPNLVTSNSSGEEVWTYQRHATSTQVNNLGAATSVTFAFYSDGKTNNNSSIETTTKSLTLIIKFKHINGSKIVSDFTSRYSSF